MNELLFDEEGAGRYLGGTRPVSKRTLQRWRLEGSGPVYIKLSRSVRYRKSDLDAFIAAGLRHSTSEYAE
ncbi:helix-turn-helix transcriptional regulator [Virgifigura deserti]|uniref:helix-turn-helix transcriptional regulator n=1 Tax=Virgifigura deserti TaxID=2268457 RepID=UPI003CCBC777